MYYVLSAHDVKNNKQVVILGNDTRPELELWLRTHIEHLIIAFHTFTYHTEYESLAHAVYCIERGHSIEYGRILSMAHLMQPEEA